MKITMMWGGEGGVWVSWEGENDRCETAHDTSPWYTDFSAGLSSELAGIYDTSL